MFLGKANAIMNTSLFLKDKNITVYRFFLSISAGKLSDFNIIPALNHNNSKNKFNYKYL